jgi:hypothetical protein
MIIFFFLAVIFAGVAVALTARTLAFGQVRRRNTLAKIDAYGFSGPTAPV